MSAALTALIYFLILHLVRADIGFTNPPSAGVNITEGSTFTVQWTTDWGAVGVTLVAYQMAHGSSAGDVWLYQTLLGKFMKSDPRGGYLRGSKQQLSGLVPFRRRRRPWEFHLDGSDIAFLAPV